MTKTWLFAAIFAVMIGTSGCGGSSGPDLYAVKGRVVSGGQPMTNVGVTFSPEDGTLPSSAGVVNSNGEFTLSTSTGEPGAVAGKHKVTLNATASSGEFDEAARQAMMQQRQTGTTPQQRGSSPAPEAPTVPFPKEYQSGDTTPLEFEVSSDESKNDFTIEIPKS